MVPLQARNSLRDKTCRGRVEMVEPAKHSWAQHRVRAAFSAFPWHILKLKEFVFSPSRLGTRKNILETQVLLCNCLSLQ